MRVRPAPCCHERADFCSGTLFSRKKSSLTHGPLRSAHWKTKTRSNMKLSVDTTHSSKSSGAEYISGKVGAVSSERGAESAVGGAESARSGADSEKGGADSEKGGAASAKHGGAPAKHASTASTAGGKTPKTRGKDPAVMVAAACGCAPLQCSASQCRCMLLRTSSVFTCLQGALERQDEAKIPTKQRRSAALGAGRGR